MPSDVFGEEDSIAAWMLDNAVTWFGITIENALQERVKVGIGPNIQYKPKHTLARLLDENYKLPRPLEQLEAMNPWAPFLAWAGKGRSGVKRWVYTPPVEGEEKTDG